MKNTQFERNKEFDRPYLDSPGRFTTTNLSNTTEVRAFYQRFSDGTIDDSDMDSLCDSNSVKSLLCRDNVSSFFSYPDFEKSTTTSRYGNCSDPDCVDGAQRARSKYRIKRNQFTEYNEQRIKFGLRLLT